MKKGPCWGNDSGPGDQDIARMSEKRKFINVFTRTHWVQSTILTYIPAKILLQISNFLHACYVNLPFHPVD
jgi:hypothetical protein